MRFLTLLGILLFGTALAAIHSVAAFAVVVALAANADPGAAAPTTADAADEAGEADETGQAGLELADAAAGDIETGLARLVVRPIELTIARPHAEDVVVFETPWWVVLYWVGGLAAIALATLLCALGMWSLGARAKVKAVKPEPGAGATPAPATPPGGTSRLGQH